MAREVVLAMVLISAPLTAGCLEGLLDGDRVHTSTAILRDDRFVHLVVEVDHVAGYAPGAEALAVLNETLHAVVHKESITFVVEVVEERLPDETTTRDLHGFHDRHLDTPLDDATAVIHVLYVNGRYRESPHAIGMATPLGQASPVFMFADNLQGIYDGTVPNPTWRKVERATLIHEVGHLMGLVNNGAPMLHEREHPEDDHHSRYETSVMYPTAKTFLSALELVQENAHIPYRFDEHDLADLDALRDGVTEPQPHRNR